MKGRILFALIGLFALLLLPVATFAQEATPPPVNPYIHDDIYGIKVAPIPCNKTDPTLSCPTEFIQGTYSFQGKTSNEGIYGALGERCAESYQQFLTDPINFHYWVEDPKITEQGKADDRARQFLYWALNTNAVDEAPVLKTIWNTTSLIAFFGVVIVAAIFGIGYIISRRTNYNFNIQIWPTLIKIGSMLLYIAFSAAIVFLLIQLSEVLMKFFIENLGGNKLFNIYFTNNVTAADTSLFGQTEKNYIEYYGCRDLNIRVQEAANSEIFLLKLTNVTYYTMGAMLLLRKVLLWFLLFVAPFLALLMPFVFIRNVGWIWIGVFFQWLFYGPLLALFLGATSTIWQQGIPFQFDFSRVNSIQGGARSLEGYVYPTAIKLLYGGPAQRSAFDRQLGSINNGNYIDTFAEYVITLIMLWAVTFFPWWLLRIFRDYCCEGIYAMKNILLAMYDQMRTNAPNGPGPTAPGPGKAIKIQQDTPVKTEVTVSLGSMEKMKKMMSVDITKNLNLQASKITDIARLETNKVTRETTKNTIAYLANPVQASVPAKRTEFMNLRTELFNRAIKNDTVARSILSSTSTSVTEKTRIREQILNSLPKATSIQDVMNQETKVSKETINNITNNYTSSIVNNKSTIQHIANTTNSTVDQVKNILNSYSKNTSLPANKITAEISREHNIPEITVKKVLDTAGSIGKYEGVIEQNATNQKIQKDQVTKIVASISTYTSAPSVIERITNKVSAPAQTVKQFITSTYNSVLANESALQTIARESNTTTTNVASVINNYVKNIDQPVNTVQETISKESNVDASTVQNIIQNTSNIIEQSNLTQAPATQNNITTQDAKVITTMTSFTAPSIVTEITNKVSAPSQAIKEFITSTYNSVVSNTSALNTIAQKTNTTSNIVQNTLTSYVKNIDQPQQSVIENISKENHIDKSTVQNIMQNTSQYIENSPVAQTSATQNNISTQDARTIMNTVSSTVKEETAEPAEPIVKIISYRSNATESASKNIIQNILNQASTDTTLINNISNQTGLKEVQVQNVLKTYSQNVDKPLQTIVNQINTTSGIPKDKVQAVLKTTSDTVLASQGVVAQVAKQTGVTEAQVAQTMQTQMQVASKPEEHIEKTISIPSSVSIEDYEQVKEMWVKHYEAGEIPVSDTIKNRTDWVEQETVYITNTLNKILSSDEKLRQDGLDELGFLLPIFLINNLKGEELIVYLKAKLEAAKSVQKMLEKEAAMKDKLENEKEEDAVFVDVAEKKEEDKTMEMTLDEEQEEKTPQSIEDRTQAVQEKLEKIKNEATDTPPFPSLEDIKSKLQQQSEKPEEN